MTEELLKALPEEYHERVESLELVDKDLMLFLNDKWMFEDGGRAMTVKDIAEAVKAVKSTYEDN